MQVKIRIALLFFSTILCVTLSSQPRTIDDFMDRLEGKSLSQITEEFEKAAAEMERAKAEGDLIRSDDDDIKDFLKSEETYVPHFSIDTAIVPLALAQFDDINFDQIIQDGKTWINFGKRRQLYFDPLYLFDLESNYEVKKLYYRNGQTKSTNLEAYIAEPNLLGQQSWGVHPIIDSMDIDFNLKHVVAYDSILLTNAMKSAEYRDGIIEVQIIEHNHISLTLSDKTGERLHVYAFNAEGKPLKEIDRSISDMNRDSLNAAIVEYVDVFAPLANKLSANEFSNVDQFKDYLREKLEGLKLYNDNDGLDHRKYSFAGNVASIKVYIETKYDTKTCSYTAKSKFLPSDIIVEKKDNETVFYNVDFDKSFSTEKEMHSLGGYYCSDFFGGGISIVDFDKKQIIPLDVTFLYNLGNGAFAIRKDNQREFLLYDSKYNLISDKEYQNHVKVTAKKIAAEDRYGNLFLVDDKGNETPLKDVAWVDRMNEGMIRAENKSGLYGFLNAEGEIAIPFIYTDVRDFSNGLAAVSSGDGKYGYINKLGKQILPSIYENPGLFNFDHAIVDVDGVTHIIDKSGKRKVSGAADEPRSDGSGANTTYYIGGNRYYAHGKVIPPY